MSKPLPATELILSDSQQSLGHVHIDSMPQPGAQILYDGRGYLVLERRHRYQFSANRYHLYKIDLYVQLTGQSQETTQVGNLWVLGDASCRYNARSEIIRCAVNPAGPCSDCIHYMQESVSPAQDMSDREMASLA